ncbi:uncharacterized protein MEPE_00803 [Melanopsichium pennsylvanicum]|uniref:Uncharacterized protein n=1 Tax=Melanopsichium pennsylvanicum TaxID=63383 RepID=A0AAJ5C309_9BASI|nr:uncharacterized protein MEPE_00803 [Melanopsichium pennsylvanicum]
MKDEGKYVDAVVGGVKVARVVETVPVVLCETPRNGVGGHKSLVRKRVVILITPLWVDDARGQDGPMADLPTLIACLSPALRSAVCGSGCSNRLAQQSLVQITDALALMPAR